MQELVLAPKPRFTRKLTEEKKKFRYYKAGFVVF